MSSVKPPDDGDSASTEPSTVELEFLLAEFDALRELKAQGTRNGDRRIEVLLALGAGVGVGLALLSQTHMQPGTFLYVAWFAALGVLAVGLSTLADVIDRNNTVVDYIRAINRIREHFAEQLPALGPPVLLLPTDPEFPRYGYQSNWRTAVVVNSLAGAVVVTIPFMLLARITALDFFAVLLAIAACAGAFYLQSQYATSLYARAEQKAYEKGSVARYDAEEAMLKRKQARSGGHS